MTESPPEPPQEPTLPGEEEKPKAPDLPDPAFPEVLPGGEDAPGSESEQQSDQ